MKKCSLVLLLAFCSIFTMMGQRSISGNVVDESSQPLIGATILVLGTSTGTVTDINGDYTIEVPEGNNTLIFSYTGYATQEIELGVSDVLNVTMETGAIGLEDVVVIGYGETSQRYKVQSVSSVSSEKLQNRPLIGPQELLQGQAAGVQMVSNGGVVGANSYCTYPWSCFHQCRRGTFIRCGWSTIERW